MTKTLGSDSSCWCAEIVEVEVEPQQYHTEFIHERDAIVISFLLTPPCEDQEQVENNAVEVEENPAYKRKDNHPVDQPKFGERPDIRKAYDFEKVEQLPFQLNLGILPSPKNVKVNC